MSPSKSLHLLRGSKKCKISMPMRLQLFVFSKFYKIVILSSPLASKTMNTRYLTLIGDGDAMSDLDSSSLKPMEIRLVTCENAEQASQYFPSTSSIDKESRIFFYRYGSLIKHWISAYQHEEIQIRKTRDSEANNSEKLTKMTRIRLHY